MIKKFLYVEHGSVDYDSLEDELGPEVKIITYNKGAPPPICIELNEPITDLMQQLMDNKDKEIDELKNIINKVAKFESPCDINKLLLELRNDRRSD